MTADQEIGSAMILAFMEKANAPAHLVTMARNVRSSGFNLAQFCAALPAAEAAQIEAFASEFLTRKVQRAEKTKAEFERRRAELMGHTPEAAEHMRNFYAPTLVR